MVAKTIYIELLAKLLLN